MTSTPTPKTLTRRQLLNCSVVAGAIAVAGTGFIAAPNAAWALEVTELTEHQMATVLQMARDIYPHDKVGDEYYAIAIKGYDSADQKDFITAGVAKLDALAKSAGAADYLSVKWETNRVALLKQIEADAFFQSIRGGLVTGLYNQKAVWPIFGYEGESFSLGGYIDRGFNDINWL